MLEWNTDSSSDSGGKERAARLAIGLGAFLLYLISQYLVLWLSRTREYFAERFAGEVTGKPNVLASALVKIAYGMAGEEPKGASREAGQRRSTLETIGAMGLFDPKAARALALVSAPAHSGGPGLGGEINRENLKEAMRWDRWNPWAKYYELHSTHPLVANRLQYLGEQAAAMQQEPFVLFDLRRPESYWDQFAVDLAMLWLPWMAAVAGALLLGLSSGSLIGIAAGALVGLGFGTLAQVRFRYRQGHFPEMSIVSLLKQVKVSAIRPVPCTLRGTVIGRGVPGLIWSEDFVMQDQTGIIFLDYRQPLAIWEFLFGLLRGARLLNEPVTLTGWYRRAAVPYVELLTMTTGQGTRRCYTWLAQLIGAVLLILVGVGVYLAFGGPGVFGSLG